jgi:hypothetical protein
MKTILNLCTLLVMIFTFGLWIPAGAAETTPEVTTTSADVTTTTPAAAAGVVVPTDAAAATEQAAPIAAGATATPVAPPEAAPVPAAAANSAVTKGLVSMVTSQLGVSEQQATAGIGALMGLVKQNLSATDYAALIGGAPDLGAAAQAAPAAPATDSSGGWLGSIGSMLGYKSVGQMAQLNQVFSQLGLSTDMVAKFIQVAMQYVQGSGGTALMGVMAKALNL